MKNSRFKPEENKALRELKDNLSGFLGDSILGLKLFGWRARGDYDDESDIDIALSLQSRFRGTEQGIEAAGGFIDVI